MNKKTIFIGLAIALIAVIGAVSQTTPKAKHHAVFQMTEPQTGGWDTLSTRINNLRTAFANDGGAEVEVVFFGPGIDMLRKTNTDYEVRLKQLADSGVKLAACQNAMKHKNLKTEDLFPFASQVDSGVAELTRKQESGFAYIH
jgi:intracellular sulfur oxidation DsrE/DsrF family protein